MQAIVGSTCSYKANFSHFILICSSFLKLYFDFGKHNVRICLVSPGFIKTPMTDKNDFKMPFLKTPEFAANKIYDGLINKNTFEIHFPKELTLTLKFFTFLPSKIYFYLVKKLTKFQKKN